MARVTVTGASDDLLEVNGDIVEEFAYYDGDDGDLLAFSDGTVLRLWFGSSGRWTIDVVARGSAALDVWRGTEEDETDDTATLVGDVRWVVHGRAWVKAKGGAL
jgi:hypothetical protein